MINQRFKKWRKPEFDGSGLTRWYWKCQHFKNLKLGKRVDIGAFSYLNAKYGIKISDYAQIGSHCCLYTVSTIDDKKGKIIIKKNARIGTHSVVMPGVTIGKNSIIGALSFVNKDIPDNSLAYGVPVRVVRGLSEKEIKKLSKK